jgi:predicted transcriptional regulator
MSRKRTEHQEEIYYLSDHERTEIQAALAEVARGEFASDEEVAALFGSCLRSGHPQRH